MNHRKGYIRMLFTEIIGYFVEKFEIW